MLDHQMKMLHEARARRVALGLPPFSRPYYDDFFEVEALCHTLRLILQAEDLDTAKAVARLGLKPYHLD